MRYSFLQIIVLGFACTLPSAGNADGVDEPIPSFYQEPGISAGRAYSGQHPNERIDPFTGKLILQHIDLAVPGAGGLDIQVMRSYTSPNDDMGEVSPAGIGWTMHFGRVIRKATVGICATDQPATRAPILELSDGSRHILYTDLTGTGFLSTGRWAARCEGQWMTVYSPNGTRYEMSVPGATIGTSPTTIQNTYYVSSITDRNGNSLSFSYAAVGASFGVTGITASDGRSVTVSYAGDRLSSVTDGSRTWNYVYEGQNLAQVRRPDGTTWGYAYNSPSGGAGGAGAFALRQITYPTGGQVNYTYGHVNFNPSPSIPRSAVVTQKAASDGSTWTYTYRPATQPLNPDVPYYIGPDEDIPQLDRTTVVGPDGRRVYFHIGYTSAVPGTVYGIGLLAGVAEASGQITSHGYGWQLISTLENRRPGDDLISDVAIYAPLTGYQAISRDGSHHLTEYRDHDQYGNPATVVEQGSAGTRVTRLTYHIDAAKWIIRQKKDESLDGHPNAQTTREFDANGNLRREVRHGVETIYTYTTQGDVSSVTDARQNTVTYSSHRRGIPRHESHPEGVTVLREVSSEGHVTSETDGENATTTYGYDGLGRVTSITRARGNPVSVTWGSNSRVVTRGAYRETTNFDGFGRVERVEHADAGGQTIVQTRRYDGAGRLVFTSYPNSSVGTGFVYDIVNRLRAVYHVYDPVTGNYTGGGRSYEPISDTVRLTNERGFFSDHLYRAWGNPDERELTGIRYQQPGTDVQIVRNELGQPLEVTQGGLTRRYAYDEHYFLRSRTDPEVGTTQFGRDAIGNLASRQIGTGALTQFVYDGLNRLTNVNYPAGTPSVIRAYYKDGMLKSLDNGLARRDYVYDANKSLTRETLIIDGQTFAADYGRDANDALASVSYSSGTSVDYQPDAFGRPTRAAPYVTSLTRHANGHIATMTYANGRTTTYELNPRTWPNRVTVGGGAGNIIDSTYDYDGLGNVRSITDAVYGNYSRTMEYDAIDRLTTVGGAWAGGSTGYITYDGVGNITSQVLGTASLSYTYDSATNRLQSTTGWKSGSYSFDNEGNVTSDGALTLGYDAASAMRCAKCGQPDELLYDYDGDKLRVRTRTNGRTIYSVHSGKGDLLWEYTPGVELKEFIYLGGKQVAVRQQLAPTP